MTKKQKKLLCKIIAAAILWLGAVLTLKFLGKDAEELPFYIGVPVFALPFLICGFDVLKKAVVNICHGQIFDENLLMALAACGAFAVGEYSEACTVMILYSAGQLIESIAVNRSRKSISAIMDIRPDTANVLREGKITEVDPSEVGTGELIVVRPGERIPIDGTITEGSTTINTVALTGEALPRDAKEGDRVVSGTVNQTGAITVRTDRVYSESTAARVMKLVEESAERKAKSESFITRFAKYYTPAVVILAVLAAFVPPLFGVELRKSVYVALDYLVISCPCAVVISVPLAFFAGIGACSKAGILVKGSNYLEFLAKTDTAVFDKTGTLTEGSFKVIAVHPERVSERELLRIAVMAESLSTHPISASLRLAYREEINSAEIGYIKEMPGMGVKAEIDGRVVYVGNGKLMEKYHADYKTCRLSGTAVHIALMPEEHNRHEDDCDCIAEYMGHIVISDSIKSNTKEALEALRTCGIGKTVMLSGDTESNAQEVSQELGIDKYYSSLLPDEKVGILEQIMAGEEKGRRVIFVGDGINDAPVLSRADVGVAMGGIGSDAAVEAADVVIMDDNIGKLSTMVRIAKFIKKIVLENIIFTILFKVAVMCLSPFDLCPVWLAVFADVGVMILAVLNSLRIMSYKAK